MSNIYNETIIVLGSLRYQSAPDTDIGLKVPFIQSSKNGIEFDRSADVNLQQVYDDERQSSTLFRPSCALLFITFLILAETNLCIMNKFNNSSTS